MWICNHSSMWIERWLLWLKIWLRVPHTGRQVLHTGQGCEWVFLYFLVWEPWGSIWAYSGHSNVTVSVHGCMHLITYVHYLKILSRNWHLDQNQRVSWWGFANNCGKSLYEGFLCYFTDSEVTLLKRSLKQTVTNWQDCDCQCCDFSVAYCSSTTSKHAIFNTMITLWSGSSGLKGGESVSHAEMLLWRQAPGNRE